MTHEVDDLDRRLLALLRTDARLPVSSLAASLGIARGTVKSRLGRMEKNGVILGYTVLMKDAGTLPRVNALMSLSVNGKAANKVLRTLKGYPEIASLHVTNGRWDVLLNIAVANLEELEQTLRRIRTVEGVGSTETSILLSQQK